LILFTGHYLPGYKGGGPIKTIKNLVDNVGEEVSFKIVTSDRDLGDQSAYNSVNCGNWNSVGNAKVFYTNSGITGHKQTIKILLGGEYHTIYLNSFFSFRFSFIPLIVAKVLNKTVILAPRGEFSEGALNIKAQKKRIFIAVYKLLQLHRGTVFQASSHYEANDIRKALSNNVDIQIAENIGSQEFARELPMCSNSNSINAVFVSRISPKKNLLVALKMLQDSQQPVSYHIYGPIEDIEYWTQCETVIAALPSHVQVEYKGELNPNDVVTTISKYDVFFMPTKGENYGHVIAEALCAGLPILIADTTPWRNLQEQGIGWDLSLSNPKAFSTVIDQLATMTPEEHHQMRETVLAWAKNKFSQRDAIEANIAMFNYAANK